MPSILGHPVLRREDPRFLTGQGAYVANLVPPDAAHVARVTSTEPHAHLLSADVADAAAASGVLGVFTAADVDPEVVVYPPPFPGMNDQMIRTMLAQEVVRYVGEPVAAVVADDPVRAADAADLVAVAYEPLPPLTDMEASLRGDVVLFPGIEDQTVYRCAAGEIPDFGDCEVVVRARLRNQRMSAAPIEARTGFSYWEGGRLIHHTATRGSHNVKAALMGIYGLDPEQVLVITPDVGGIDLDRVVAVGGDTDCTPRGQVTGGSRSAQIVGSMLVDASQKLVDRVRPTAAELLEAAAADVVHDPQGGCFHVAGTPAVSVAWGAVAAALDGPLTVESDFESGGQTFPFGTHVAVVEVDVETGRVGLVRLVAVDDAGTVLNPLIFEGQVHGGIAGGVAQALMEELVYDADANPLTTNFADYPVISAAELPSFELIRSETPADRNLLGAKGIGESGTVGATAAVQNAVIDALACHGIRHLDMPLTPERVWKAIDRHG